MEHPEEANKLKEGIGLKIVIARDEVFTDTDLRNANLLSLALLNLELDRVKAKVVELISEFDPDYRVEVD